MGLVAHWSWGNTAKVIDEALTAARILSESAQIAVVGKAPLAKGLRNAGRRVLVVAQQKRLVQNFAGHSARAEATALPLGDKTIPALVGIGGVGHHDWQQLLSEWSRVVSDEGVVVLVDKAPAHECTKCALLAGLVDLQQYQSKRAVITTGRVRRF